MRRTIFYPAVLGFIFGIGAGSILNLSFWMLGLCGTSVAFLLAVIFSDNIWDITGICYSWRLVISVVCVSIFVGMLWSGIFLSKRGDPLLKQYINQDVIIQGVVDEDPSQSGKTTHIVVSITRIRTKNDPEFVDISKTRMMALCQGTQNISYGDSVELSGLFQIPSAFQTDTGETFQYGNYLASQWIYYEINAPNIHFQSGGHGDPIKSILYKIKNGFIGDLKRTISFPESTLAAGLTVAGKYALPQNILQDFTRAGALQVVVLSGYNVTIVAEAIILVLGFLPRIVAGVAGIFSIWLFTILTGGSATVVRGALMASCVLVASLGKRNFNVYRAFFSSIFIMLVNDPLLLMYDPSFQFSFLATAGLIYGSPIFARYLTWVPERFNIRATAAATISTQCAVTPMMLYSIGGLSTVAVPVNLLLFLPTPLTMFFCFMTGTVGTINLFLGHLIGFVAWLFLFYQLSVVHIFASFPFSFFTFYPFPLLCVILLYVGYGVFIWKNFTVPMSTGTVKEPMLPCTIIKDIKIKDVQPLSSDETGDDNIFEINF